MSDTVAARRRFELRDASGQLVAVHVREDLPGGAKRFRWEQPDGRPGLDGVPVSELPLYGIEHLDGLGARVVIVEGEKAAEALWSADIAAVATVTGAASAPGRGPLGELSGRHVALWPDADAVGRRHMATLAERLTGIAASVSIVALPEDVPSGWDAADAVAQGRDLAAILAAAEPAAPQPATGRVTDRSAPTSEPEVIVTRLSSVVALPLDWLWPGYIPAGMLTILDGDPGLGKTLVTLDLAARVTRGWPMPGVGVGAHHDAGDAQHHGRDHQDDVLHEARGAVLLSAEDDLARTIRPRLDAAGADVDRIAVVTLRERDGTTREPLISADDLVAVEQAIREVGAALLVVDPLVAYLPDAVNTNRDHDVRRSLALLADLAERTGAAVVAVRHLRKAGADNPLYRGGGSIGIIGAARAGLLVARDPEDPSGDRRVIAATKSNLGPLPASLAFTVEVEPSCSHPHVAWQGESAYRAAELLATAADRDELSAHAEAADFLRGLLADGPVPSTEVYAAAAVAGIATHTLERAKKDLGVRSVRPDGFTRPWSWALSAPYIARERRTSPRMNDGEVRERVARYGADAGSAGSVEGRTDDNRTAPRACDGGQSRGDAAVAGWRCTVDLGTGHVPALRSDGSVYCGTCHP